jgi:mono/diheme cytochrome c family protein
MNIKEGTRLSMFDGALPRCRMNGRARVVAFIVALSLLGAAIGLPQGATGQGKPAAGLADVMITAQMRHIKLWFAGKLGNWRLAGYELGQMEASLNQAESLYPAGRAAKFAPKQVQSVRDAIERRDAAGFSKAYTELTNECNSCHRALDRSFITIQVPPISPFTDQLFVDQLAEGRALAEKICGACHVVSEHSNEARPVARFPAPSFAELARRPSLTQEALRQLLSSGHRYLGPNQAMPNPRLAQYQVDEIIALLDTLRVGGQ